MKTTMKTMRIRNDTANISSRFLAFWLSLLHVILAAEVGSSQAQTCTTTDGADDAVGSCKNDAIKDEAAAQVDLIDFSDRVLEWNEDRSKGILTVEWGVPQTAEGEEMLATIKNMFETFNYMNNEVFANETFLTVRDKCQVRNELCSFWAAVGECENNPDFMAIQCAPSCKSCLMIDHNFRCPYDKNDPGAWNGSPNALNRMFERMTSDPDYVQNYTPTVLSRDPWVVQLDNFVSEDECQRLIDLGAELGYQRSEDVGAVDFDGSMGGVQSDGRTSTNAWCVDECYDDPISQAVTKRIEDLVGVPEIHYEYLQLLRYEVGQFYNSHHDYIAEDRNRPQGVRILTVFIYLNTVEEGGGTDFPELGLTVQPKRGSVVVWPSVLNDHLDEIDDRTRHQALPVKKGIKYGANAWVHQRDFKTPHEKNCV